MHTAFLAWLMIAAPALSSGEPREERVTILRASNLRHEIVPSTHEHLVLLDIVMRKEDWERVEPKDLVLEYQNCPKPRQRVPNYYNYGIPHFQGTGTARLLK